MGQTLRFLESLHEEWDELEAGRAAVLARLTDSGASEEEVQRAIHLLDELSGTANALCRQVWLKIEPGLKNEDSEILVLITQHVSQILLCQWEKWTYKPAGKSTSESNKT
jgi:hypothetical protein